MWVARLGSPALAVALVVLGGWLAAGAEASPSASSAGAGSYVLTATNTGSSYAPTFTGNGMLGVRVPPSGQGYAAGSVAAQSELAGFYAQAPGDIQKRANIPTWSTLTYSDGGQPFSLQSGSVSGWRQSINFKTGIVTTTATWTAPDGHVTDLSYQVLTDRARQYVGLVQLTLTPHWSGTATVTDEIDGTPADMTSEVGKGWNGAARADWVTVKTQGTGISATLASQLGVGANVAPTTTDIDQTTPQSVGQQLDFPVSSGQSYTITKYVGIQSSQVTSDTVGGAQSQAAGAAGLGWNALINENNTAWAGMWRGRIDVLGNPSLATIVNASQFYLWSSTRAGVNWSISPAGLSSNGYSGHIFWDAETWMYPSLLAQHPDVAAGIDNYRYDRLRAAEQHAAQTGYKGARFPWESALDGTEQIPPPVSVNSEGLYEQHITADIALAQWQYYLATGNKRWLRTRGWPVLSRTAQFWASRVTGSGGRYHINHVTGPDEENPNVNDEMYTNVAAKTTLADAVAAARVLHVYAPARWSQISRKLVVLTWRRPAVHPEFRGYRGQLVKQADVTLTQYPWLFPMSAKLASDDLNYYVPRTDPTGPSMSDAVNEINTSALGTGGCASYVYTERSFQPFLRDVFDQFSETKTGGAFTFMTGIGGFLQEFLYGYSGLRWGTGAISLSPSLSGGITGVVLHDLSWHGSKFTVSVGSGRTTVKLTGGPALRVMTPAGLRVVRRGSSLSLKTRRPDLSKTSDAARCGRASASSAQPGAPALAAVDGSPATDWQPQTLPATLTVTLRGKLQRVRKVTLAWGRQWPPAPGPNIPPPPTPVKTVRASSYVLYVSGDGRHWRKVASVSGRTGRVVDVLRFKAVKARFVKLVMTASSQPQPPMLDELTATG